MSIEREAADFAAAKRAEAEAARAQFRADFPDFAEGAARILAWVPDARSKRTPEGDPIFQIVFVVSADKQWGTVTDDQVARIREQLAASAPITAPAAPAYRGKARR